MNNHMETATFAGGCFWCTEAIYKRLIGVLSVIPGYSGGTIDKPSYEQVSTGLTGHAESIQIVFDPTIVSYETLLDIFWHTHNPTTRNKQGNDIGTQYRSAIFYHNDMQKQTAEKSKTDMEKSGSYDDSIVTQIEPFTNFYPAEDYHKNYYDKNRTAPYCSIVIDPKIRKLLEKYENYVKENYRSSK